MPPTTTAVVESTELEPPATIAPRGTWDARTESAGRSRAGVSVCGPWNGAPPEYGPRWPELSELAAATAAAAALGFARVAGAPSVDAADALIESAGMSRTDVTAAPAAGLPTRGGHRLGAARDGAGRGDHDSHHGHLLAQTVSLDAPACGSRAPTPPRRS